MYSMNIRKNEIIYHVMYEDNDSEDMNDTEYRLCIDLYRQLEDGEINEWD